MSEHIEHIARALIRMGDDVLLARTKGADNTFLPGGHIEFGESAEGALIRELQEELGLIAVVQNFRGAVEHTFEQKENRNVN